MNGLDEKTDWWASLKHGGLLIAPSMLLGYFPDAAGPLPRHVEDRLRRDITRLPEDGGTARHVAPAMDTVLEEVLGLGSDMPGTGKWLKGPDVPPDWSHRAVTGEAIRPRRLWQGREGAELPVFVESTQRLGIGHGRRMVARVHEWLRRADRKLALLTNARQWRLIYAGLDHDAYAEADSSLWFQQGRPGPQVTALRTLLSVGSLTPQAGGGHPPLLAAILDSRKGQAELSAELGERVRQAVELLIRSHGAALHALDPPAEPGHVYLAATRVMMRLVVVLFAEARELLPRENPVYFNSYGLQGLHETLERAAAGAGAERLRQRSGAWPRVLGLFSLIRDGSAHQALPVPRYGGGLFEPGDPGSNDPVLRALAVFETACFETAHLAVSDADVHEILKLLTRSRVKVRQGRRSTWMPVPVDFSDLSSEYLGILYEGLLDFELRRVTSDDPVVFLNLGDEPALPLSRLEGMDDASIETLAEKFKQKRRLAVGGEEDEAEEEAEEIEESDPGDGQEVEEPLQDVAEPSPDVEADSASSGDARQAALERAAAWARRAVVAGKLVARSRSLRPEAIREHEETVARAAGALVARVVLPGEWYLVRFGGTRKGSGTFYTKPALAVPTVRRTLLPLACAPPLGGEGRPNENAPSSAWSPRAPEEILALKVCDPACGSGSFLVGALRFFTQALAASLHAHGRLTRRGESTLITLADGKPGGERLAEDLLPCPPGAEDFDARLATRLKRHVVERCLYGVDINPLAVELCRLALWIETMDRDLPFSFLDHKVKPGNALVGCWFDRFRDYPALAWEREGGDKGHTHGVRFEKGAWTRAIKAFRNTKLKSALAGWLSGQGSLFDEPPLKAPEAVHDEIQKVLEQMHAMAPQDAEERAAWFRKKVQGNDALARLKGAFDLWCALWFWPAESLDCAPLPTDFAHPPDEARTVVAELAREHRFFHWELEFPDVFRHPGAGFDAVVGNPPWETQKPSSKEFFSNLDPLYRTYGKQEALNRQRDMFQRSEEDERAWLTYSARFNALSNWCGCVREPWGDPLDESTPNCNPYKGKGSKRKNADLHASWRNKRQGRGAYAVGPHPFRQQGSADINTYKLFLEMAYSLAREGGRLGMIVPSGLYTDKGATALRLLLLERCRWQWLFSFENRDAIFDIHRSFKFSPVIAARGGSTDEIRTAFMRRDLSNWEEAERFVVPYARAQVERFSPKTRAILEIRERRDLEVLEKIYANSVLLGDDSKDGWGIRYACEFHMTNDSHLFQPRPVWEAKGYRPDEYSRWLRGRWRSREPGSPASPDRPRWDLPPGVILSHDHTQWLHEDEIEGTALPLYQGIMVNSFDPAAKGWISGTGLRAVWERLLFDTKRWRPQFLMSESNWLSATHYDPALKIGYREVARTTDARSFIGAVLPAFPCGHKVPVLRPAIPDDESVSMAAAILNSLTYDWLARLRLGAAALAWFVLRETRLPLHQMAVGVALNTARLNFTHVTFSPSWLRVRHAADTIRSSKISWRSGWALTPHERLRLRCLLDAVVGQLYGLDYDDLAWILRDCDHPVERLRDKRFSRSLDPKGFWRVDKEKDPELRHTVLTLVAFRDLKATIAANGGHRDRGIETFCTQNNGNGWMLPEALRLADLGVGHDDRAKTAQPVASRLGNRFYPFQLEQNAEDSWKECELHARNLLGAEGFEALQRELRGEPPESARNAAEDQAPCAPLPRGTQSRLFPGEQTLFGDRIADAPRGKRRR